MTIGKKILFIFTLFLAVAFTNTLELNREFDDWISLYQKVYSSKTEQQERYKIWIENVKLIEEENSRQNDYELEINEYTDLTWEEFQRQKMGLNLNKVTSVSKNFISESNILDLPNYVNWTAKGVVTPVKNQGMCGSCWAFSTTGAIESMQAIQIGKLVSLSEENLIDCSSTYGNLGCLGGLPERAMNYIIANNGIDTEASYPLTSVFENSCMVVCPCKFNSSTVGAIISNYTNIIPGNETDLQYTVAFKGPVSVAFDAMYQLQSYKSGVFSNKNCSTTYLNHAVLVVGYGTTENGTEYYIVKNSWGENWGMNGYFLLARNQNNMCGITNEAIYPLIP